MNKLIKKILCAIPLLMLGGIAAAFGQDEVYVKVVDDQTDRPLTGASVALASSGQIALTDSAGTVRLSTDLPDKIIISFIGYEEYDIVVADRTKRVDVRLVPDLTALREVVVSTGYYDLPLERATGAFTHINQSLIERSVSPDIISRLEGITNGLQFDRTTLADEREDQPELRVRGLSSIESETAPLIVLDNFPFEGNMDLINPNDVESVTVLKDASAASIWGARAGNGVIVITTKRGSKNSKNRMRFSSNITTVEKPDLFYNQNYVSPSDLMEIQEIAFDNGLYRERDDILIPYFAELLIAHRDGRISDQVFNEVKNGLMDNDLRRDAARHLYQNGYFQQYFLSFDGGSDKATYYLSAGFDKNEKPIIGNDYTRISLHSKNSMNLTQKLTLNLGLKYNKSISNNNGVSLHSLHPTGIAQSSYTALIDKEGNHLSVPIKNRILYIENAEENGLLDWGYYPIKERDHRFLENNENQFMISSSLDYMISKNLRANISYNWYNSDIVRRNHYDEQSWHARDIINRYTQTDGKMLVPYGGVLSGDISNVDSHNGRVQLDFNKRWTESDQGVKLLAGAEVRQQKTVAEPGYLVYGYNDETLIGFNNLDYQSYHSIRPRSFQRILGSSSGGRHLTDRFVSYYANGGYDYKEEYLLNASVRWDASNIFGVKTNQKGVPLWSFGGAWILTKNLLPETGPISFLKTRVTYGVNGNVNRYMSSLPTILFTSDLNSGLQAAYIRNAGNPNLRWEKVKTLNVGLDFGILNERISGSLDYYIKKGEDLIGEDHLDPTTGIFGTVSGGYDIDNRINYADLQTTGLDLQLNTVIIKGAFSWNTTFLVNIANNRIKKFMTNEASNIYSYFSSSPPPIIEISRDAIYSIPWYGLDPESGMPFTPNGDKEYASYFSELEREGMILNGVSVAPLYGSVYNELRYKGIRFGFNIIWKAGYYFRRESIDYNFLLTRGRGHLDYTKRWHQPGDEKYTQIPAFSEEVNVSRDAIYTYSEQLIEKGDHIRLKDANISYVIQGERLGLPSLKQVKLGVSARNMGLIWSKTKSGIDPGNPRSSYPQPLHLSFSLNVNF